MSFLSDLFGSKTPNSNTIKALSSVEFKSLIENKKVQLIDVRTPQEFKNGNIKGAKNIDFFSRNFNVQFNKLNKEKAVYLYCRSGSRSRQSAYKLADMGFIEIYDLKGGLIRFHK